jgi:hypothetical protein
VFVLLCVDRGFGMCPPSKESYRKCVSLNETESCALLTKAVKEDSVRIKERRLSCKIKIYGNKITSLNFKYPREMVEDNTECDEIDKMRKNKSQS